MTSFSGSIGNDVQGEQMRKRLKRANISAHLEVIDKPTAKAVSLVTHGKLREIYLRHSKLSLIQPIAA